MRTWTMMAIGFLCAACPCDPGTPEVFYDGFESGCGDLPCGWTQEAGTAARVSTFHGGEHGVLLSEGARITRLLEDVELGTDDEAQDLALLMIWCDPEAGLEVTVDIDEAGTPGMIRHTLPPGDASAEGLMEIRVMPLEPRDPPFPTTTATRLTVGTTGTGTCTVDELRILSGRERRCHG